LTACRQIAAHDERALGQTLANLLSEKKPANAEKNERIAQGACVLDQLFASTSESDIECLVADEVYA